MIKLHEIELEPVLAVRRAIGVAVYPVQIVVDSPARVWSWLRDLSASKNQLQLENSRLRTEALITRGRMQELAALKDQIDINVRAGTVSRDSLAAEKHLTIAGSRNLADALHFVQQLRIKHQCEQIVKGEKVSNFINPSDLPKMAKEQLRDAFTIIDEAQSSVRQTYRAGLG